MALETGSDENHVLDASVPGVSGKNSDAITRNTVGVGGAVDENGNAVRFTSVFSGSDPRDKTTRQQAVGDIEETGHGRRQRRAAQGEYSYRVVDCVAWSGQQEYYMLQRG